MNNMIYQVKGKKKWVLKTGLFKIKGHDYKRFYNEKPDEDYDDKYIINNMIVLMNIL